MPLRHLGILNANIKNYRISQASITMRAEIGEDFIRVALRIKRPSVLPLTPTWLHNGSRKRTVLKNTLQNAKNLPFPKIISYGALQRSQRHISNSIARCIGKSHTLSQLVCCVAPAVPDTTPGDRLLSVRRSPSQFGLAHHLLCPLCMSKPFFTLGII